MQLNPARRLTPFPTPRLMKRGLAIMMLPQARADRRKSLAAKSEAASRFYYKSATFSSREEFEWFKFKEYD